MSRPARDRQDDGIDVQEYDPARLWEENQRLLLEKDRHSRRRDMLRWTNTGAAAALVPLVGLMYTTLERTADQVEAHQRMYVEIVETVGRIQQQVEEQSRLLRAELNECDARVEGLGRAIERERGRIDSIEGRTRSNAVQAADSTVLAAVVQAIEMLDPPDRQPANWTDDGRPRTEALGAILGRPVGQAERDRAWTLYTLAGGHH